MLALAALSSSAETPLHGRVVSVADGDTVTLLDTENKQYKIRLAGIDAPEKGQPFGKQSKANLSLLAFGRIALAECSKQDRYKRHVCKVLVNEVDVNLEQVRQGYAWHYEKYQQEQSLEDRANYSDAQRTATVQRRGLWSDVSPVPPWDWRAQKRDR